MSSIIKLSADDNSKDMLDLSDNLVIKRNLFDLNQDTLTYIDIIKLLIDIDSVCSIQVTYNHEPNAFFRMHTFYDFLRHLDLLKRSSVMCDDRLLRTLLNLLVINIENIHVSSKKELIQLGIHIEQISDAYNQRSNYELVNKYMTIIFKRVRQKYMKNNLVNISVIIPVYNVAEYISECLESIYNQTFKNFEVICVDDASTDNSMKILKKYKNKHENMYILKNSINSGVSIARNKAMKYATGKYILFVDPDDLVYNRQAFENLYKISENNNLDMLLFKSYEYDDITKQQSTSKYNDIQILDEFINTIFKYDDINEHDFFGINVTVWSKIYNREFLEDINASFIPGIIHQDNGFFYHVFIKARRVSFIDAYYYNYRVNRRNSAMYNLSSEKPQVNKHATDILVLCDNMLNTFITGNVYDKYKKYLLIRITNYAKNRYYSTSEYDRPRFYSMMKELFNKMITKYKVYDDLSLVSYENKKFFDDVLNDTLN
ncbi:glycosyltransferase [Methanosphaera sp.]